MKLDQIGLESAKVTFFFLWGRISALSITAGGFSLEANFPFFFPLATAFNSSYACVSTQI